MDKQKNNYWHVLQVAVFLIMAALALSCGSSKGVSEEDLADFSEGFRQGWNATAPEEYRY